MLCFLTDAAACFVIRTYTSQPVFVFGGRSASGLSTIRRARSERYNSDSVSAVPAGLHDLNCWRGIPVPIPNQRYVVRCRLHALLSIPSVTRQNTSTSSNPSGIRMSSIKLKSACRGGMRPSDRTLTFILRGEQQPRVANVPGYGRVFTAMDTENGKHSIAYRKMDSIHHDDQAKYIDP